MASALTYPKMQAAFAGIWASSGSPVSRQTTIQHLAAPTLGSGSAVGQVQKAYSAPFTVTAGAPLDLDLTALTDLDGNALTFANYDGHLVSNDSIVNGQDFTVGNGTAPITADVGTAEANGGWCGCGRPGLGVRVFPVTSAGLATPTNAAFSTATTGGFLVAGTYYYRVSALNANGETLASAETSQVVPGGTSTNTVVVNWGSVAGATGYRIYGRATGAELFIAQVGAVTTYTDTGAITPAGALPAANTTAGTAAKTLRIIVAAGTNVPGQITILGR